jgi:hypothetical protein
LSTTARGEELQCFEMACQKDANGTRGLEPALFPFRMSRLSPFDCTSPGYPFLDPVPFLPFLIHGRLISRDIACGNSSFDKSPFDPKESPACGFLHLSVPTSFI